VNLNLLKDAKVVKAHNGAAAGTSAQTTSTIDTAGFDSALVIADLGTVTDNSVLSLKAQDGAAANGSDAADIAGATTGTLTAATSSNSHVVLDLQRIQQRYLTCVFGRTTQNAVLNSIVVILYNAKSKPVTQPTTVVLSAEVVAAA
jgi:hypothetical protein